MTFWEANMIIPSMIFLCRKFWELSSFILFYFFFLGGCGGVEELGGPGVFVLRIPIAFIAGCKLPVNVLWYQNFHFTKLNYITCIEEYNVVMVIGFDTNWQIGNNYLQIRIQGLWFELKVNELGNGLQNNADKPGNPELS